MKYSINSKSGNTPSDTKYALVYARVSTKKQVIAGDGLNSQLSVCLAHAERMGYEVEGIHTDDLTGSTKDRNGLQAILAHLRANPRKRYRIVFDHINRFTRDYYLHSDMRRIVDAFGGILESPQMVYGDDSASRLVENMSVAVSDYSRKQNIEQTNARMRARLRNGYAVFCAPAGYEYGKVAGHAGRVLTRKEPIASVVVEALEGYASGHFETAADVQRFFEAHPLFPKSRAGKVPHQRVGDILRNPTYAGLVGSSAWDISLRQGHHQPLISIQTHQQVQDRLNGINRAPSRKHLHQDFPLRGFVMCDDCGSPLTACWSKGSTARHPYYLCPKRGCAAYGKSIRRSAIEDEFEAMLQRVEPAEGVFAMAAAMIEEQWQRRQSNGALRAKALADELKRLEAQIEQTVERIIETSVPTVMRVLEGKVEKLETQRLALREQIATAGHPEGNFELRLRTALDFLASPWKIWRSGRFSDRQAVLKLTFADQLRYKRGEGFRTANLALPFKVLGDFLSGEKELAHPTRFERVTFAFGAI